MRVALETEKYEFLKQKGHSANSDLHRAWQLEGLISRWFILAVLFSVLVLVQIGRLVLLGQPNLLHGDVVLLNRVAQPGAMMHVNVVMEDWLADHAQLTVERAVF